jgi:hypothetical protein
MPVANGADNSKFQFNKNFTQSNGQTTRLNFTTYVDYKQNADKTVTATTYLMYVKPNLALPSEVQPANPKLTGNGSFYVTAGVLENGKFKAIPYSETQYLKNDGALGDYTPSSADLKSGNYPVSNQVRAEMVSPQAGSLNAIAKDNATEQLKKEQGITPAAAQDAIKNGTAPPAGAPPAPGSDQGGATSPTDPVSTSEDVAGAGAQQNTDPIELSELKVNSQNEQFFNSIDFTQGLGKLEYPLSASTSGQDVLKIEILKYNASTIGINDLSITRNTSGTGTKGKEQSSGTIYLGLQASITDQNTINWGPDPMTPIDMAAQIGFLGLVDKGTAGVTEVGQGVMNKFAGNKEISQASVAALKSLMAKMASNTGGNLFTRVTGAIVNPNMELLFNGPQLRPFTFTFNMSPRDKTEAKNIKAIIKALKQSSAVQIGVGELFLKTPFIYKLSYRTEGLKDHPSLNRIKECALTNISIDYTPANVYMTYNDTEKTMTSYSMQLQFMELDPIYGDDYKGKEVGKIGY